MQSVYQFIRSSIRNKLIVLLLISTIVPIATSIFISYQYTKSALKERVIEENKLLISEAGKNLINYLEAVNKMTLSIYSNPNLVRSPYFGSDDAESVSLVMSNLQNILRSNNDIFQVYYRIDAINRGYILSQQFFSLGNDNYSPPNLDSVAPYSVFIEPTHRSHDYAITRMPTLAPVNVFTLHRPLYKVPTTKRIGWLSVDIQVNAIRSLMTSLYEKGKEDLLIVDNSGSLIFTSNEDMNNVWFKLPPAVDVLNTGEDFGSIDWNQHDFSGILIYSQLKSSFLEWTVIKRIPSSYMYQQAEKLTMINTIVASVFLIIANFAIIFVTFRITVPIKQLLRRIAKIQSGQLNEPIDIDSSDEIGKLAGKFKAMMQTINDLIIRGYKLDIANKSNQLKMLQAQTNPHFMNNALQSIGNLALESNEPKIYQLISSLGQMMHYTMNTNQTIVKLIEEISYVQYYLVIQQQRFENKFHFHLEIAEETKSILIPKMIIQPLIENYFKHGFDPTRGEGILSIRIVIEGDNVISTIEDNGIGIPEERLAQLQNILANIDHYQSGGIGEKIGLMNVALRLRLYYSSNAALQLSARMPSGLKAILILPI